MINTTRIKGGDVVRIHAGETGHFYDTQCVIPYFIGHFTIEGVLHDGLKPVLGRSFTGMSNIVDFLEFEDAGESLEDSITMFFFANDNSFVIRDGCGITIRNLKICHFDEVLDDEIPESVLDRYAAIESSNDLLIADPGIVMHGPTRVEACEFESNIVGATMICVSSIADAQEAHITGSRFYHDFVGAVVLETSHEFAYNTLEDCYLTGVMMEKGAHGRIHDNLFLENGCLEDAIPEWRSGLLSHFDIVSNVPHTQTPLIYSNTFVDNYHALSITESVPSMQFLNMPILLNNIVYYSGEESESAVYLTDVDRSQIRSQNGLYYCDENWMSESDRYLISCDDMPDTNPLFYQTTENKFRLTEWSPCLNSGLHPLVPGITSEGFYSDYHILDAGYHFSNVSSEMGPVENLTGYGRDITWTKPPEEPEGYLVIWEDGSGSMYGSAYPQTTSYEIDAELEGLGFWFGVSAFSSSGQFGMPVFIQM